MGLDDLDLRPYKSAARARGRNIYVYIVDDIPASTIHLSTIPMNTDYILVNRTGQSYRKEGFK